MRIAAMSVLFGAGLLVAVLTAAPGGSQNSEGQIRPRKTGVSADSLIAFTSELGEERQRVTVIDSKRRVMSVYQIDGMGRISLQSVRNIHWDLQIDELNTEDPLPQEIRALLGRQR